MWIRGETKYIVFQSSTKKKKKLSTSQTHVIIPTSDYNKQTIIYLRMAWLMKMYHESGDFWKCF